MFVLYDTTFIIVVIIIGVSLCIARLLINYKYMINHSFAKLSTYT